MAQQDIMKDGTPYPYYCGPVDNGYKLKIIGETMAQQTAVEWLEDNLIGNPFHEKDFAHNVYVFKQAKAMQKEQIIRFAISCHQDILRDRNAPESLISENMLLFEQYYNEIYNK